MTESKADDKQRFDFRFFVIATLLVVLFEFSKSNEMGNSSLRSANEPFLLLPFSPNLLCPSFFVVMTDAAGLGHRIGSIIYALYAAKDSGTAIALHDSLWSVGRWPDQERNSLMYLRRLLDLRMFFSSSDLGVQIAEDKRLVPGRVSTKWGSLLVVHSSDIDDAKYLAQSSCNQIIEMRSGYAFCRNRNTNELTSCALDSENSGSWEDARPLFRMLYERGQMYNSPLNFFDSYGKSIIVSWHVRNGDITLNTDPEFWKNLVSIIESTLVNTEFKHFIFSERDLFGGPFEFLHNLFKFSVITNIPPELSIHHMANSDILVSTGSSFSITAALLAPLTQIHLCSVPKEGQESSLVYALSESLPILGNGSVSGESAAVFKLKVASIWRNRNT